ncbi:MAG TPA: DUF364 domain-containing protein [Dehalococcoidia bacterium]|nr:DUF364 domain-containing protein [Dehalococcoidia bacterium]
MKILDELIASLNCDEKIKDIRLGVFQTAVYSRQCGLASTPHASGYVHGDSPVKEAGSLMDKSTRDLVEMVKSENLYEAAIGMAALNSLIVVDTEKCRELNAATLLAEKGIGKKVAIVGHFPFIEQLKKTAEQVWVIEKNPIEEDYPEEEADRLISQADVVGITGMAITNHSLENLLSYCSTKTYVMILGGTTPLSPVLFDYGIDSLSGTVVTRSDSVLNAVSQGATYRQLKDVKRLIMEK